MLFLLAASVLLIAINVGGGDDEKSASPAMATTKVSQEVTPEATPDAETVAMVERATAKVEKAEAAKAKRAEAKRKARAKAKRKSEAKRADVLRKIIVAHDAIDNVGGTDTLTCAKLTTLEELLLDAMDVDGWTLEQDGAIAQIDSAVYQMKDALACPE